jgi:dihydroorotate dehydrogenase
MPNSVFLQKGIGHAQTMISDLTAFMKTKGWQTIDDFAGLTLNYLPEEPLSIWYR